MYVSPEVPIVKVRKRANARKRYTAWFPRHDAVQQILDADWSTRPRTAFWRATLEVHPKLAEQLSLHRFVACPYRFLAGKQGGKQLFLRVLRATEPHSTLPTLRNFRMYLGHTDPTLSNLFRHNHGNHNESQQVTTRRRHVAHANARATRIQRGTKVGTKAPPTVP